MKDFMMIFIGEDYADLGLTPEEIQNRMGKWGAWHEKMEKAGIVKYGEALHAKAKHITGPNRIVTDGPFAETKDLIGGFYVIKAESFDSVVKIAQDFPDYDLGSTVEIREVMVIE
jgi:hypothetical protein